MDPSAAFVDYISHRRAQPCANSVPSNHVDHHEESAVEDIADNIAAKNHRGWRRVVLNFTPSWFSVIMGTGITSILLHNLPYNGPWLFWISVVIFCLNICLFIIFTGISILRYTLFRGLFSAMLRHPVQSLFCGTFPMGLATIINMIVFVCVPYWGQWVTTLAWVLWWVDSVIAIATCVYLPFLVIHVHKSQLSTMTAVWLLPIVSTIVASATGGVVAEVLPNPQHQLWTLIISYILWGTGFPLAMVVLVMYFHRLTIHHLPPREVIVSVFLPLGPIGQGTFALEQLGKVAIKVFPATHTLHPDAGNVCYIVGHVVGLIIWGYGLVWLFFALASITRSKFPFNMGWWGFTFPLGVYAVATTTFAKDLPSAFFKVLGMIFSLIVVFLWLGISIGTMRGVIIGDIFSAPCVKDYEQEQKEKLSYDQSPSENAWEKPSPV